MNRKTRRLSRIPPEVKAEIDWVYADHEEPRPTIDDNMGRIEKLEAQNAHHVRKGFMPHWSDLDMNRHVNYLRYIRWIIESVPESLFEKYELAEMKLEYRRECQRDSVLESYATVSSNTTRNSRLMECHHLLLLEDGSEVMRGCTHWKPKETCSKGIN